MVTYNVQAGDADPSGVIVVDQDSLWTGDQEFHDQVVVAPNVTLAIQGSVHDPIHMILYGKGGFIVHPDAVLYLEHVLVDATLGWEHAVMTLHPKATAQAKHVIFQMNTSMYTQQAGVVKCVATENYAQELTARFVDWTNVTCRDFYYCFDGEGLRIQAHDSIFFNNTFTTGDKVKHGIFSNSLFWNNDCAFGDAGSYNVSVSNSVIGSSTFVGTPNLVSSCIFVAMKPGCRVGGITILDSLSYGNPTGFLSDERSVLRNVTALDNQVNLLVFSTKGVLDQVNLIKAADFQLELQSTTHSMTINSSLVYWGHDLRSTSAIQNQIKDGRFGGTSGFVTVELYANKPFLHDLLTRLVHSSNNKNTKQKDNIVPDVWLLWEEYAHGTNNSKYSYSVVADAVRDWLSQDEGIRPKDLSPVLTPSQSPGARPIQSPFGNTISTNKSGGDCDSFGRFKTHLLWVSLLSNVLLVVGIAGYCRCVRTRQSWGNASRGKYSELDTGESRSVDASSNGNLNDTTPSEVELK